MPHVCVIPSPFSRRSEILFYFSAVLTLGCSDDRPWHLTDSLPVFSSVQRPRKNPKKHEIPDCLMIKSEDRTRHGSCLRAQLLGIDPRFSMISLKTKQKEVDLHLQVFAARNWSIDITELKADSYYAIWTQHFFKVVGYLFSNPLVSAIW